MDQAPLFWINLFIWKRFLSLCIKMSLNYVNKVKIKLFNGQCCLKFSCLMACRVQNSEAVFRKRVPRLRHILRIKLCILLVKPLFLVRLIYNLGMDLKDLISNFLKILNRYLVKFQEYLGNIQSFNLSFRGRFTFLRSIHYPSLLISNLHEL